MQDDLEDRILAREWFYRYPLPSGRSTKLYISDEVARIHDTRLEMMTAALSPWFARSRELTAVDFASHQGFFSINLARQCRHVLGLEYQQRHVDAANMIKAVYEIPNVEFIQEDVEAMPAGRYQPVDIVIVFGLLYNLENPIGVLRRAREMTKQVLLVETQTTILDLEGRIDSGHHASTNHMQGFFGVFAGNPENIDGSASDIVLYPSPKGLLWILRKLGFAKVEILPPPAGAYQQLATGKRIMVKAEV